MTASGSVLVYLRAHVNRNRAVIVIDGELDATSADRLAAALAAVLARRPARLVIDLRRVGFIDCAALRVITSAAASLPAGGLRLHRPSPAVRRMINLTGLGADMVTGKTVRSALR